MPNPWPDPWPSPRPDPRPDFGIRPAGPEDVGAVTGTLAEGFLHGDLASWLIPDRATRRVVYADYFRMFAEFVLEHGQVDVTDDVDGVALWWPVGRLMEMEIPDYDQRLAAATGTAVGRFRILDMAMHSHHPTYRPHHYLMFVAVHPDRQGSGIGGALLDYRHQRLDQEATPAYLEATGQRNRALYERHGYAAWPKIRIPGGPELFPMWRPGSYREAR